MWNAQMGMVCKAGSCIRQRGYRYFHSRFWEGGGGPHLTLPLTPSAENTTLTLADPSLCIFTVACPVGEAGMGSMESSQTTMVLSGRAMRFGLEAKPPVPRKLPVRSTRPCTHGRFGSVALVDTVNWSSKGRGRAQKQERDRGNRQESSMESGIMLVTTQYTMGIWRRTLTKPLASVTEPPLSSTTTWWGRGVGCCEC